MSKNCICMSQWLQRKFKKMSCEIFRSTLQYRFLVSSPHTCITSSSGEDRKTEAWREKLGESKLSWRHMNWGHCNCYEIMSGRTDWWGKKPKFVLQIVGPAVSFKTYISVERGWDTSPGLVPILLFHPSADLPTSPTVTGKVLKLPFICISTHLFTFL